MQTKNWSEVNKNNWDFLDTIYQAFNSPTEFWDKVKNGNTNQVNYETAMQNLDFQRENLDYQKALQEEIFNREDTSYQRTVEDMRAAGLNPLTMTGTNGAGEAISTQAPQNNFQMQDQGIATAINEIASIMNNFQNFQIGTSKAKTAKAEAEIAENNATESTKTLEDKIWDSRLNSWQKQLMTEDIWRNAIFNREYNVFNGMDETNKWLNMLKKYSGEDVGNFTMGRKKENGKYNLMLYGEDTNGNFTLPKSDLELEISKLMADQIKNITEKLDKVNKNGWKGFFSK